MSTNASSLTMIAAATLLLVGAPVLAADNAGPEPYSAADPHYAKPMEQEPLVKKMTKDEASSLGSTDNIKGPAAGPEPYSAPTPKY